MKLQNIAYTMQIIFFTVLALIYGKAALIPFTLAALFSFLIIEIAETYKRAPIIGSKLPHWLALPLSVGTFVLVCIVFTAIVGANIHAVIAVAPTYQKKLLDIFESLGALGLPFELPHDLHQATAKLDAAELFKGIAETAKTIVEKIAEILLYSVFFLVGYESIGKKIKATFGNGTEEALEAMNTDIRKYVVTKGGLNLLAAGLAYAVMAICGLDFAALWALLIFVLHFIPAIGGIVSLALPIIVALVQFGLVPQFFVIVALLGTIMFFVGHVLEPKLMGESLDLWPPIIMLSLFLWGMIWGVTGMFLCIPFLVIAKVILNRTTGARNVAIWLSASWKNGAEN